MFIGAQILSALLFLIDTEKYYDILFYGKRNSGGCFYPLERGVDYVSDFETIMIILTVIGLLISIHKK